MGSGLSATIPLNNFRLGLQARGENVPSSLMVTSQILPSGASAMVYGMTTLLRRIGNPGGVELRTGMLLYRSPLFHSEAQRNSGFRKGEEQGRRRGIKVSKTRGNVSLSGKPDGKLEPHQTA